MVSGSLSTGFEDIKGDMEKTSTKYRLFFRGDWFKAVTKENLLAFCGRYSCGASLKFCVSEATQGRHEKVTKAGSLARNVVLDGDEKKDKGVRLSLSAQLLLLQSFAIRDVIRSWGGTVHRETAN